MALSRLIAVVVVVVAMAHGVLGEQNCTRIDFVPNPFDWAMAPAELPDGCSDHGTCILETCFCDDGFSGRSDFVNTEGVDCQINLQAIRIIWGISLATSCVYIAQSVPRIKLRFQQALVTKAAKEAQGKKYSWTANRGLMAMLWWSALVVPALLIYPILKIVRTDEEHVARTFWATYFFATGKVGFYTAVYYFQPSLIKSILKGTHGTRSIVNRTHTLGIVFLVMGCTSGLIPFITLLSDSDGTDSIALAVFYATLGLTLLQVLGLGIQAQTTKNSILKVLNASLALSPNERTEKIKVSLVKVQRENTIQASIQFTLMFFFLSLPMLINKHDYFLPVTFLAYAILGKKVAYTAVSDGSRTTGSGTGTGSASSKELDSGFGGSSFDEYPTQVMDTSYLGGTPKSPASSPPSPPGNDDFA